MSKFYSLLIIFLMFPVVCVAEDKEPQLIAVSWTMVPKADHGKEFEEAFKAHLAYRAEKGDPRHWDTYEPVTGSDLNRYIVRSCCVTWASQDEYITWSKDNLGDHFSETVNPHVESYSHNIIELDMENSNWGDDVKANYVGVTNSTIKQGKSGQLGKALAQMSTLAKEHAWPRSWAWSYPVAGGNTVNLATPFENYADMAPMDEDFYQFVKKHLKSDKKTDELFDSYSGAISDSTYQIYRHNKEMSSQHAEE